MQASDLEDWLTTWRRRQWRFAGKLLRTDYHKWSNEALMWDPILHGRHEARRRQARPQKRWDDDFTKFVSAHKPDTTWKALAIDGPKWRALEKSYVEWTSQGLS